MLTGLSEAVGEDGVTPDPVLGLAWDGEVRGAGVEPPCPPSITRTIRSRPTSVFAGELSR